MEQVLVEALQGHLMLMLSVAGEVLLHRKA